MLHIMNARDAKLQPVELLIDGGKIAAVGEHVDGGKIAAVGEHVDAPDSCDTLDANGCVVAQGVLDMHVHLRDPGFTHKEDIATGGAAAVAGGVTTVACMPNTKPVIDTPATLKYVIDKAAEQSPAKVLPIASITVGEKGKALTDFATLKAAGAVAFSDDGVPVMDRDMMKYAMLTADKLGIPIIAHCEDFDFTEPYPASRHDARLGDDLIITNMEESEAARNIGIALETGATIHIAHISTAVSAELVRRAKKLGARVTCETCPHYLLLDESVVAEKGTNAKMNPQLRTAADRKAMVDAVCDGTVDAIVTDHAPHSADEKAQQFDKAPNGIIGLETLISGVLTALSDRMSVETILDKMTASPRKLLHLPPQGLVVGADADLTLIDIDEEWTMEESDIHSKSHNTPFIGFRFKGRVTKTIVDGMIVFSR